MRTNNSWLFYGAIALALAIGTGGAVAIARYVGARGIRNNNPGNIRKDGKTKWEGAVPDIDGAVDAAFVQFKSPEYGIRAIARVLASYQRAGLTTVAQIIGRWAPPTENNTAAYVAAVLKRNGWLPTRRITPADYPGLIASIIQHENGSQPYPSALIQRGINLA